jgi:hypothetical protein
MDEVENEATKALHGEREFVQFGEWNNVKENKIVTFEGIQGASACRVYDGDGHLREDVTGIKTKEVTVLQGDKVYAQAAWIQFRSAAKE